MEQRGNSRSHLILRLRHDSQARRDRELLTSFSTCVKEDVSMSEVMMNACVRPHITKANGEWNFNVSRRGRACSLAQLSRYRGKDW